MFFVHIAGHLGKDPETRFTPSGQKVTTFSIATNMRRGKEEMTVWVRVTVWGDRFDKMISFLKKGSAVMVAGKMNPPSSYTDKEGRTQISLEVTAEIIEFSPFGRSDRADGQSGAASSYSQQQQGGGGYTPYESSYNAPAYEEGAAHKPAGSQAGQGKYSQSMDDDNLPF